MPPIVDELVVLRTYPYSDSSLIVRALSADQGTISLLAKGARRPGRGSGLLLESFVTGEAVIYQSRGSDLHTLGRFSAIRSRQTIGRDLGAFAGASLLAEIVLRTGTPEPSGQLYSLLVSALDALAIDPVDALLVSIGAGWEILAEIGFAAETDRCLKCGREIEKAEASTFDPLAGGAACAGCRPGRRLVPSVVRRLVAGSGKAETIDGGKRLTSEERILYRDLFLSYLRHQVEDEGLPYRSVPMVQSTLR